MSDLKLNPAIAKMTSSGQIQCIICNTQVKPKVWVAHLNGRKHAEAAARLKESLLGGKKRTSTNDAHGRPVKRLKEDTTEIAPIPSEPVEAKGTVPSDFFDDAQVAPLDIQTPWQKAKQEEKEMLRKAQGVIEGLPQGFFDDKKKDNLVRETIERNAQMDEEFERFMREVNETTTEEEQMADAEAEREARERDLDNIDLQMRELQRLNELEIRKEQLLLERHKRTKKVVVEDDDDTGDYDFDDWRGTRLV